MKYPSWKDIVREELLSDFKDYEDKKKNDEQLSLLKQKFSLIKKIYRSNNPFSPRYFLLRIYMFIIGTYYLKLANLINIEFFHYSGWMTLFITLIHIALLILVSFLLFGLPYVLYNKMFGRNWDLHPIFYSEGQRGWITDIVAEKDLRSVIRNVKDLPNFKLQNLKLFKPIISEWPNINFWIFWVEIGSLICLLNIYLDSWYFTSFFCFQVMLLIFPSIRKFNDRYFSFSSLFINHKINEKLL